MFISLQYLFDCWFQIIKYLHILSSFREINIWNRIFAIKGILQKLYFCYIRIHKGVQHAYRYYRYKGIYKIRVDSNNSLIISTVGYQLNINTTVC